MKTALIILGCCLLVGLVLGLLKRSIGRAGKKAESDLRQAYGEQLTLLTGCGVISGMSRVPGLLGLAGDRLVYRALVLRQQGEIPLTEIESWQIIPTGQSTHQRVHKYRLALVIELVLGAETRLFVVAKADAERWRSALAAGTRALG